MDSMKSIYGSEYDAGKFLWGTISKFSTKRILYGHCKADGEIEELYQSTLEKIKAAKSSDTSFLSCYEVVLNLCLIYSNMVECRVEQEKCIRAVWTEINIIAVYYWIAALEARAEKLVEKYDGKAEKMDGAETTDSLFKIFQQALVARPILQATKELLACSYMIDILCATVTRSEEIRKKKGHSR